ncbi:SCO4225 family membrane protein [Streptomyces sp. NPDC017936]|uniref:SCO4225 family membrane protein n=1 Tax=Streptomyces sp. NPDC017936 TaxID=3365016 RepID=UPI0037B6E0A3
MPNASRRRRVPRLRRLLVFATGHWLARGYLAGFAASVLVMFLFPGSAFASGPLMLTAPLSLLSLVLPFGPGTEGSGAAAVFAVGSWTVWLLSCALVNAAVLGALVTRSVTTAPAGAHDSLPRGTALPEQGEADRTPSARPRPHGVRALLAPAVDNWLARGYLAVVAVALGFFLYAVYLSSDPGFAGIWPLMATAPFSILALLMASPVEYFSSSWLSPLVFSAGVTLSGLVNAALLGSLARRLRAPGARPVSRRQAL